MTSATDVMFVTQTAYVGGGMEHWLVTLANGLGERGVGVSVALLSGPRFHDPDRFMSRHPLRVQTDVVACEAQLREERVGALLHAIARRSPRIIVPVGCADAADASALAKSRGAECRLVMGLHGHSPLALTECARTAPYTDLAVSVSRHGADLLVERAGLPPDRVRHIPFGIESRATREKSPREMLRLAYVGRLDAPEKRVDDLVGIMRELEGANVALDIVGEGPQRGALEHAFRDEIAKERVRFHGYVDDAQLRDLYDATDVLLILSPSEGGPICAWEAMAHGVVVVTSDFEGRAHEPAWRPGENSLVFDVGDVRAAAAHVRRMGDPVLRRKMSEAARELPRAYSRAAFVASWRDVLLDMQSRPVRGADVVTAVPASSGRLGRFPRLRRVLRHAHLLPSTIAPQDPGDEWPGAYSE